ncbi:hypothetical protein [Agaricicola taiwanensis]|uniref:hypothetical protein n=1 Tax=Agaricicola taiwanensis TaxID=591372 RepID=UPI00166409DC|nr:hypothetical protein [Agaricicola taiwanensis]
MFTKMLSIASIVIAGISLSACVQDGRPGYANSPTVYQRAPHVQSRTVVREREVYRSDRRDRRDHRDYRDRREYRDHRDHRDYRR